MKTKFTKFLALMLTFVLSLNLMPLIASAGEYTPKDVISYSMDETYISELKSMGFSTSEIEALNEINNKLANASSFREIDRLMKEYHTLVDDTPLAVSSSIYSPNGGTLELDYTGPINPSNVIYTKVVYLPTEQVVYYQRALHDEGFIDFLVGEGIGLVTSAAAQKIATYLKISSSSLIWLIGLPISATFFILQHMEAWDLDDAIDESTAGKVKLEFFYMTSITFPYYQEFENFEPWNSSYVDIPADYDYDYYAGEYNYD